MDTIEYKGIQYPTRDIEYRGQVYTVATTTLSSILFDDSFSPVDNEAQTIDELVAYYLTPEEMESLTYRQVFELIND